DETVRNLGEVSPTVYFNVPAGYAALLPFLERDETLARSFFGKLRLIFYAGAALPQDLWERLEAVSQRATRERVPMTSSWGSTETSPLSTAAHFMIERAGPIGVPVPGVELKLVPTGDKLEVRVRGPHVTPGYWKRPDLTRAAFDEDGFYKPGDAVRFDDPAEPAKASCSTAAWPRTSSSPPAPGSPWARSASQRSPPPHRRCGPPSSPARTANGSACSPGSTSPAAASSSAAKLRCPSLPAIPPCASTSGAPSPDGTPITAARRSGLRACYCCRTRPPSTPTRSPTRPTSTSGSRSSAARPMSSGCLRRRLMPMCWSCRRSHDAQDARSRTAETLSRVPSPEQFHHARAFR